MRDITGKDKAAMLDMCIASARAFEKLSIWKRQAPFAYELAENFGWLDACTLHMT
jgi:hypothetical protein